MKIHAFSLALLSAGFAFSACGAPPADRAPSPSPAPPAATVAAVPAPAGAQIADLLIRGGTIMDGTGSAGVRGDVVIRGDRIVAVGQAGGMQARDTIDATGLVVSPGWIDMLGHSEYPLLEDGRAISKITQGITSEITGEVTSVVPVNGNTIRELGQYAPLVRWGDLNGYFAALEAARPAINLGTFVTVGSTRRYVMGDANRAATPAELDSMRAHVDLAMRQGAFGLSSGLAYAPASFASAEEISELARVAGRYGGGYASHIRSEGAGLVRAVEEAIQIGERGGTWVQVHHLKASGRSNWGRVRGAVEAIEAARARGVDVAADQYPYAASGTGLDAVLPGWVHEGGTEALLRRLSDPATRGRIRAELLEGGEASIGASAGGPTGVQIADVTVDSLEKYQGMRLSEYARLRGQNPADAVIDLLIADRAGTAAIYFSMSEDDIEYVMRQPWVMVGIDAGSRSADPRLVGRPHPRAYGSFPRVLCRYVRERGVMTMPEAIRRFTSLPAARLGLDDRGMLRAGMFADLTIFDPATVCDRATFVEPVQLSTGIRHVIVNGVPVLRDGTPTNLRGGRPLRRTRRGSALGTQPAR
ncbi:MAG TPA: D-aminoacylase [Longimicrobium sp.]|jgi:N-acyl-D-aspartate/D-glutamate deacylase|uniref:N-acyl-D-amino-acid deacylase family protein n=1 Tax=Longimicrobium sp. TaxID=2029185 RepID=UPI002EDA8778